MKTLATTPPDIKFEISTIHSQLFALRGTSSKKIIGYIGINPDTNGWFWVRGSFLPASEFNSRQEAIEDLIIKYNSATLSLDQTKIIPSK